ncbi:hypothetical protein [Paracoccus sp. (in: a-proteobacteria)]|uniref:hypothetical protein n=1 Tax=Paracoccus sp. TaxID=267 RepID=UPI00289A5925|nr:hypothetical protein [Paracoccus sp. (in: a-proteobacteria)]
MNRSLTPFRPKIFLTGFVLIYGLTIISCYLVNEIVRYYPIGPWRGEDIAANYWLDNVSWQIFSAWWACLLFCCGFFPFDRIQSKPVRGVALTVTSWILGWLSAKLIFAIGPGVNGIFPLVGTTWFLLALICFAGGNWPVEKLPKGRQFALILLMIIGGTYLITHSAIVWIPAWWFPFLLVGLGTTTLTYITRGLSKPSTAMTIILILFAAVALCVNVSASLGIWDFALAPISQFWIMGHFTADQYWLLWFFTATSVHYAMPVITMNYPFTRIAMPFGGLLACAVWIGVSVLVATLIQRMIGPVFEDMNEALTYAYMGVNWSLVIPLVFGIGFEEPYAWAETDSQNLSQLPEKIEEAV